MELDNTTATPAELLEQVNKAITTVLVKVALRSASIPVAASKIEDNGFI